MPRRKFAKNDLTKFTQLADQETETDAAPAVNLTMPKWSGTVVVEGIATGDGRLIEKNSLEWTATEDDPQLIRYVQEDVGAHDGAQVVGRIYGFERQDDGQITAHGDFDMGSEVGREAFRQVDQKLTRGVSIDLDEVSFEIRVAAELIEEQEALYEAAEADESDGEEPSIEQEREVDEDGRVTVVEVNNDAELFVITDARIRAATLVATPAFSDAYIEITDYGSFENGVESVHVEEDEDDEGNTPSDSGGDNYGSDTVKTRTRNALIAAAAPKTPPAQWFSNPSLTAPTALNITDDGRVFGHIATWDTCHIADPAGDGQCVTAPYSNTDYAYFHTGVVRADDGKDYAVGHITMDTGHAKPNASPTSAMAHYDHTGAVVADVRAGEDSHGIWIAGTLRSSISEDQVRALRSAPLSGDWRRVGGNLEMVAALAVNVPGFPIPRTQGMVASGATTSLVAAGVLPPKLNPQKTGFLLSTEDVTRLRKIIDHSRKQEKNLLAQRVHESKRKMAQHKVNSFAKKRKG